MSYYYYNDDDDQYDPSDYYDRYDYDDPYDYDDGPYDPRDDYDPDDYDPDDYDPDNFYDDYDQQDYSDEDDDVSQLISQMKSLTVGKEYRRYGYFKCDKCNNSWQSARTYCEYKGIKDGKEVFEPKDDSKQACLQCKVMYLPYKNYQLRKSESTDGKAAHLSHLCERCINGKSCCNAN